MFPQVGRRVLQPLLVNRDWLGQQVKLDHVVGDLVFLGDPENLVDETVDVEVARREVDGDWNGWQVVGPPLVHLVDQAASFQNWDKAAGL